MHNLEYENNNNINLELDLDIVPKSLEYYDKQNKTHQDFYNKINYIRFIKEDYQIEFFDKNKESIKKCNYEILGTYDNKSKIWSWAWSNPMLNKYLANVSKKIFNYGFDLENNIFLKQELVTSKFKISNKIQLDIHIAIGIYLAKKNMIYTNRVYDEDTEIKYISEINNISIQNVYKKEHDNPDEPHIEQYLILNDCE